MQLNKSDDEGDDEEAGNDQHLTEHDKTFDGRTEPDRVVLHWNHGAKLKLLEAVHI